MIVGWLMYSLLTAVLLTVAARLFEVGLHGMGRSTRWIWLFAMLVSVAAPPLLLWAPAAEPTAPLAAITSLPAIEFAVSSAGEGGSLPSLRAVAFGGWVALSLVVLAMGAISMLRLAQRRREWPRREVDGVAVLISRETGPAVVGVRRCEIVIPEWALSLSETERAYMLRHEQEHARAGDPRLLFVGAVLAALVPWNVCVWYQLRRLVLAIEVDCDRRVLARGGDAGTYAKLLLEFGQRLSRVMLPVTAFAEPVSILERRIRQMTARKPRRRVLRLVGAVAASAAMVTVAAALPVPREASLEVDRPHSKADRGMVSDALAVPAGAVVMQTDTPPRKQALEAGPVFTPFTKRPELKNKEAVARVLEENYPDDLREAGIGGSVETWFLVDETGRVVKAQVSAGSGYKELDDAALRTALAMEFTPALNRDKPVKVWVAMPIVFNALAGREATVESPTEKALRTVRERNDENQTSPVSGLTTQPELSNHSQVAAALQRLYPPLLRDAGIGGEVFVLFDIDATGRVTRATVGESSGHPSLDEAALKAAYEMRFTPARNGNTRVATRLGLPITFRSQ